jgi:hypothetical protein
VIPSATEERPDVAVADESFATRAIAHPVRRRFRGRVPKAPPLAVSVCAERRNGLRDWSRPAVDDYEIAVLLV